MTARAVADRAGAQLGLIHYHFGGFPQLKLAVADTVIVDAFRPVLQTVADARTWQDGLAEAIAAGAGSLDGPRGRLSAELIAASLQEDSVRERLAAALHDAREQMADLLVRQGAAPEHAPGLATTAVALLDGLLLHCLIDQRLPWAAAAQAASRLS
jgi:AcrR family transcriptional regulator